jgi:transcriptional regulator with XRE-family HTH domain
MDGTEVRAILARNIKTLRSRRNWSQADLAEKSEISIVYLSDIERENKWPYLDTLVKLAAALNVDVYELLKPEDILPHNTAAILAKYNEEIEAIFAKSLELAQKHASQSLAVMRKHYIKK